MATHEYERKNNVITKLAKRGFIVVLGEPWMEIEIEQASSQTFASNNLAKKAARALYPKLRVVRKAGAR